MSFPVEIGDVFSRVSNAGIDNDEAGLLIEQAAESAAEQVRQQAWQLRQNEIDLFQRRRQIDAEQDEVADANRTRIEAEEVASRKRNAELLAAESVNGPKRR